MEHPTLGRIVHFHAPDGVLPAIVDKENGASPGLTVFRAAGAKHYENVGHGPHHFGWTWPPPAKELCQVVSLCEIVNAHVDARLKEKEFLARADLEALIDARIAAALENLTSLALSAGDQEVHIEFNKSTGDPVLDSIEKEQKK